ncbi:MAG TPA: TIGR03960 family B12-binding radical SAM protein [Thermoflexia bacterium]|nr:TIGR03960 family B12-binding radical SAM protein [Thermoflexia bacterium]
MQIDLNRLERILPTVRKPGRYVGGEYNATLKDWETTPTRICLAFPDIYDLGMSNLGLAILYDILNALPDVLAERAYMPWVDMLAAMREFGIPLYSLESKRPLADFDIIGFSLPSEQLYTNMLEMLDLAGLPVRASERGERHPLVIAGGHAAFNPEPVTDFVDIFVIGDGEEAALDLVRVYQGVRGDSREAQLRALVRIPGLYVPRFYNARYNHDGTLATVEPSVPKAALPVLKRIVSPLPPPPTRLIVPNVGVSHNRAAIEIQRGCTRGCRFCHAGMIARPVRERPVEQVLAAIEALLPQTGFEEVGLLSLSTSDYSDIGRLVDAIGERFSADHLAISLPALRADSFSVKLAEAVARGRRTGFTFAPEAATGRLRFIINKPIATDQMLDVAREVFESGSRTVKLYFMIGLPGERMEDVQAIADVARDVRAAGRRVHGRKTRVNVSVNTFVPKPHTPFQWVGLETADSIREKQAFLQHEVRGGGLKLSYNDPEETLLEAALARGDRRLGQVVQRAWEMGARFDAWGEQRDSAAWARAFEESGLDPDFYARRERPLDEVFPWEVVSAGVSRKFLLKEYRRSQRGELLADCRERCHGCGILNVYGDDWSREWRCPSPNSANKGEVNNDRPTS